MIKIVTSFDSKSAQNILVLLRLTLTGPISNRDVTGETSLAEILENLNITESIVNCGLSSSIEPVAGIFMYCVILFTVAVVLLIIANLHSRKAVLVEHISSS